MNLPYADGTFDAVYAVTALGEIPEPDRVLREAARVLAPGGRLVIGEFFDRHWIPKSVSTPRRDRDHRAEQPGAR